MAADHAAFGERVLEVKKELAEKAAQDSDFRAALLSNPAPTIENEYGLEAGALSDVKFNVVEEPADGIVIPIPPDLSEMELSDEQLDQVAGGAAFVAITVASIAAVTAAATTAATVTQNTRAGRRW